MSDETDLQQTQRLLLHWYYCFHAAISDTDDAGDASVKPHFLSIYKRTDDLLGEMRGEGRLPDELCSEVWNEVNK